MRDALLWAPIAQFLSSYGLGRFFLSYFNLRRARVGPAATSNMFSGSTCIGIYGASTGHGWHWIMGYDSIAFRRSQFICGGFL